MTNGYGMSVVTVSKGDLIDKLEANKAGHRAIYEEALAGYQEKVLEKIDAFRDRVLAGDVLAVVINLPKPEDHTGDYDRILTMCRMSVADNLELTETEFAQYVMDDWGWKRQFLASNSAYSQTARTQIA
jgi:hypothetical protein